MDDISPVNSEKLNIYQRINKIRLKVEYIQKDAKAEGYKAVSHDMVTSEVRPYLIEYGVVIVPRQTSSELRDTKKSTRSGTPITVYIANYEIDFVNIDDPSDKVTVPVGSAAEDHGDKGPGKAISYATKYAMLKLFSIETGESDESRQEQKPKGLSEEQQIKLREICESYDLPIEETLKAMGKKVFGVNKTEDIPEQRFDEACKLLEKKGASKK